MNNLRVLKRLGPWFAAQDTVQLALLMTLLWVVLFGPKESWYELIVGFLMSVAIIFPATQRDERLWFALLSANLAFLIANWYRLPNDFFLFCYWTLGIFLALATKTTPALSRCAQLLLGCTFAFSTLWKVLSPDFLSGDYFMFQLHSSSYLSMLTDFISSLSRADILANGAALPQSMVGDLEQGYIPFVSDGKLIVVAKFMSLWATVIEACLAFVFLLPTQHLAMIRDGALILFMLSTYSVLPVASFGVLLATLGYVQSNQGWSRIIYLFIFFALQLLFFRIDLLFGF